MHIRNRHLIEFEEQRYIKHQSIFAVTKTTSKENYNFKSDAALLFRFLETSLTLLRGYVCIKVMLDTIRNTTVVHWRFRYRRLDYILQYWPWPYFPYPH